VKTTAEKPVAEKPGVVRLNWTQEDGVVIVTPHDEDRFLIKLGRAIQALQRADEAEKFRDQFDLLLRLLAEWLTDRNDVADAYLTLRDGRFSFVVVRKDAKCDDAFEDELSELDQRLAKDVDLDLIKLDAISLPSVSEEARTSFLDPDFTLQYAHGERSRSPRSGQQKPRRA
jgi:hypothetical protein